MKISRNLMLLVSLSTLAFADETMCFKKNFTSLETINTVKLDGGLCLGKNSRDDMQSKGWSIKNIEIKNDYYIYIFKKTNMEPQKVQENQKVKVLNNKTSISKETLKQEIMSEIRIEKKKEEEKIKIATKIKEEEKGKKLYVNKCASCHGINGETKAGYSKALNSITLDRFKHAMNGYKIGSYNLGDGSEMRPYSTGITTSDINAVYKYLKNKK